MLKPLIICALVFLSISCKKEKTEDTDTPKIYPDYSGLTIGNYWIYECNSISEDGIKTFSHYDSFSISGDTIIRGQRYFIKEQFSQNPIMYYGIQFLRDSLHYIVDEAGEILFSSEDYNRVFKYDYAVYGDTVCKREYHMGSKDSIVQVPAGSFKTGSLIVTLRFYPKYAGSNPVRNVYFRYAEGVGLVYSTSIYALSIKAYEESALLRYKIN